MAYSILETRSLEYDKLKMYTVSPKVTTKIAKELWLITNKEVEIES